MKYIITQLEIVPESDTAAIAASVKHQREFAETSDWTERSVCDNERGTFDVVADNRGQNPTDCEVLSTHATEAEAQAEADRLNAEIDATLTKCALIDSVELPDSVEHVWMGRVESSRYPQWRRVTISYRVESEFGPLDFETAAGWSVNDITNRDVNAAEVAKQIAEDFPAAYAAAALEAKLDQ